MTTAVCAELAELDPPALLAVTTERIVSPTSLLASVYVLAEALPIFTQPAPDALQSSHAYAYPVGLPDHDPLLVDNVSPCTAVPLTAGAPEFTGAAGVALVTAAVCVEVAELDPPALVAVTTTSIVSPTSEDCSV